MREGIPQGWRRAMISEVAQVFLGKTPAKADYTSSGNLKVVKFRDLRNGRIDFHNSKNGFVRGNGDVIAGLRELRRADVLITSAAHSGENIGKKCAYVSGLPDEFERVFFTGELLGIRCEDETLSRWIYLFFRSAEGFTEIQKAVTGVHLTGGRAKQMTVPLAPPNEQRRIVAKLKKLLAKVDGCQNGLAKISVLLKRFRQSVLAAACSGRLTADWRQRNPDVETAKELLPRIKGQRSAIAQSAKEKNQIAAAFQDERLAAADDELGFDGIPDSWLACRIGAIGAVVNGSTPSRKHAKFWNGDIPWVSSGEVRNNNITATREKITNAGFEGCSVQILPRGTVLLAMIGEGKTRGQSAILRIDATINQNIAAILLTHGLVNSEFLWRWFQFSYEATRERGSGSGPQALNCQRVRELPFILPPLAEQQEIVRRVEQLFVLADQIETRCARAKAHADNLTQAILSKAFRGELVPTRTK